MISFLSGVYGFLDLFGREREKFIFGALQKQVIFHFNDLIRFYHFISLLFHS
jgi:hypothetical protein